MNASENGGIRVCLVDDNPFERGHFENWIRQDNGIEILGSFDDLESALPVMRVANPDVLLLDYGLPGIKGGAAVQRMKTALPSCRVLVVTGIPSNDVVFEALEAGADGFLDKEGITAKGLLGEIRAAHAGKVPLSDRARRLVLEKLQNERPNLAEWNKLTEREKEIANILKRGLPDKEIARVLNISVKTVRVHLDHIFSKLDAHDRYEIQFRLWGVREGGGALIEPDMNSPG